MIFTIRLGSKTSRHTLVEVYDRDELAGVLTIRNVDVGEFARLLSGPVSIKQTVGTIESGAQVVGVKIDRLG